MDVLGDAELNIFISHTSEETSIMDVLKDWIESTFLGQCSVHASSDTKSLPEGNSWIDEIDQALDSAKAFLVLCSPESLKRPWINLAIGWAWVKGIPVIPICHSGQKKEELPPRISAFQSLEIQSGGFVLDLFTRLAKHLGFDRFPRIDQNAMANELTEAVRIISKS